MEKSKLVYRAREGLMLEGLAYTIGGIVVEPVQLEREEDKPKLNTGMYYVTVTMMVDEVELS